MIARLEKIEGKSSSFNFPNDSIPQLDSQGVLQTNLSAASGTSIETPVYGMPTSFYLGQSSLPEPTPVRPPPMAGLTAPSGQMMGVPGNTLLTVKIRQPSHEFTFGVGMSFIPYPLVLTPVV
jgi:hypothetical protein